MESNFVKSLRTANAVFERYKEDQPKWWKLIDGTPILNDVAVRMAQAFQIPDGYDFSDLAEAQEEIDRLESVHAKLVSALKEAREALIDADVMPDSIAVMDIDKALREAEEE